MKIGFIGLLNSSWKQTKAILFPFRFKKWLLLALIAIFGGEGIGISIGFILTLLPPLFLLSLGSMNLSHIGLWIISFCILVLFIIVIIWFRSRFRFVFLYDVVHNDASLKEPFRKTTRIGNSYFTWNVWFAIFTIGLLCLLVYLVVETFKNIGSVGLSGGFMIGGLWAGVGFVLMIVLGIIVSLIYDLAVPIMLKKQLCITAAFRQMRRILKGHSWDYIKFFLVRGILWIIIGVGVSLIAGIVGQVVGTIMIIVIMSIDIILAAIFSAETHPPSVGYLLFCINYYPIVGLFGVIGFIVRVVTLPIPVFFRIFSLKFLAKISPENDLFQLEEGV